MEAMTSMQRVLAALAHREPDRVPYFFLFTTHGAKELGIGIREYFSRAELVAEGQLRLRRKFRHDCLNATLYACAEVEAWGGETVFSEDGPPNAAAPCIEKPDAIPALTPPRVADAKPLQRVLELQRLLKERSAGEVPILGTVISPYSLPVMQLGFERYLELMYQRPELFDHLMRINSDFCVEWANAQLEAGATAISYFDPVSSTDLTPAAGYAATGAVIARRTISRIKGPTAIHFGSGRCLGIVDQVARSGTSAVGAGCSDDLSFLKATCRDRLCIIGNLNAVEMRRWSPERAAREVRRAVAAAAQGGGFILSDNHGDLAWQIPEEVLLAIAEEVRLCGCYPVAGGGGH